MMPFTEARPITGGYQRSPNRRGPPLASMGRGGDTSLAHVTPEEQAMLRARGGAGTVNPATGLPEFYPADRGDVRGGMSSPGAERQAAGERAAREGGSATDIARARRSQHDIMAGAEPSMAQSILGRLPGMAMPGISTRARPNYRTGEPELATSFNPIGALASFASPVGFNPIGDAMAPGWADIELGAAPFGQPSKPAPKSPQDRNEMGRMLVRSVLNPQAAQPAAQPPPPPAYGQPGWRPAGNNAMGSTALQSPTMSPAGALQLGMRAMTR